MRSTDYLDYSGESEEVSSPENSFLNWLMPTSIQSAIGSLRASEKEFSEELAPATYEELRQEAEELFSGGFLSADDERVVDLQNRINASGFGGLLNIVEGGGAHIDEFGLPTGAAGFGGEEGTVSFSLPSYDFLDQTNPGMSDTLLASIASGTQAQADTGSEYSMSTYRPELDPFSGQSILEGMSPAYKAGKYPEITPDMVQPLKASKLRGLHTGYYTDWLEGKKAPLIAGLTGQKAKAADIGSGFAGYGGRKKAEEAAEGSYLDRVLGLYGDIDKYKYGATQDILGQIQSWQDLGDTLSGDIDDDGVF